MQRKTSFQYVNGVFCLSVTGYLSDFERESPQILTKGPRPFSRSCLHVGESLSCRSQSCCVSRFFRNSPVTVGKTTWTTQQNSLEKGAAETERRNRRPPPSLRKWKGKFFFEFRGRPTDRPSSWVLAMRANTYGVGGGKGRGRGDHRTRADMSLGGVGGEDSGEGTAEHKLSLVSGKCLPYILQGKPRQEILLRSLLDRHLHAYTASKIN